MLNTACFDERSRRYAEKSRLITRTGRFSTCLYTTGVLNDGSLYISGQGPIDLKIGKVVSGMIEQTRLVLSQIRKILNEAGCRLEDEYTCDLAHVRDFDGFDSPYSEFFTGVRPARTTVPSVLWGGIKVEIDAITRVPGTESMVDKALCMQQI